MFTIANLREQLGVCENEYTELKNLKARALDFSIKNINEKTDISIMYNQYKQGSKIIGFTFYHHTKTSNSCTIRNFKESIY